MLFKLPTAVSHFETVRSFLTLLYSLSALLPPSVAVPFASSITGRCPSSLAGFPLSDLADYDAAQSFCYSTYNVPPVTITVIATSAITETASTASVTLTAMTSST
jgi:hypothetical protein